MVCIKRATGTLRRLHRNVHKWWQYNRKMAQQTLPNKDTDTYTIPLCTGDATEDMSLFMLYLLQEYRKANHFKPEGEKERREKHKPALGSPH